MSILGYIGYAALLALAVVWTVGVRVKLDAGAGTVFGALFFLLAALWLTFSDTNKLYSLVLIPVGLVVSILFGYLAAYSKSLFVPFRLIASIFAAVVRVGIPEERIRAAQETGLEGAIDEWASKGTRAVIQSGSLSSVYKPLHQVILLTREAIEAGSLQPGHPQARLACALFFMGMIDAASQAACLDDPQFLELFSAIFQDLDYTEPLRSQVLLFHQSAQLEHPAYAAVLKGGEVYTKFCNGDRTIVLAAGMLIEKLVSDPSFPATEAAL